MCVVIINWGIENTFLYGIFSRLFDTVQESAILKFIIKRKTKRRIKLPNYILLFLRCSRKTGS